MSNGHSFLIALAILAAVTPIALGLGALVAGVSFWRAASMIGTSLTEPLWQATHRRALAEYRRHNVWPSDARVCWRRGWTPEALDELIVPRDFARPGWAYVSICRDLTADQFRSWHPYLAIVLLGRTGVGYAINPSDTAVLLAWEEVGGPLFALAAAAGLSPEEAQALADNGQLDEDTLLTLIALRGDAELRPVKPPVVRRRSGCPSPPDFAAV